MTGNGQGTISFDEAVEILTAIANGANREDS